MKMFMRSIALTEGKADRIYLDIIDMTSYTID